jgi:hypothetical protein
MQVLVHGYNFLPSDISYGNTTGCIRLAMIYAQPTVFTADPSKPVFRHCKLRGTKQEAKQSADFQWIASSYRPRNDGITGF